MPHHDLKQRFEVIYVANYADILAYVRRRTDSHEDAADALAETFATAWRRLSDVPDGEDARLWLFGVARRVLANGRRADTRRSELVEQLGRQLAVWAERVEPDESRADVREAFARLSDADREIGPGHHARPGADLHEPDRPDPRAQRPGPAARR